MTKGPHIVTPKPHNSCNGCDDLEKLRASTGGIAGPMTYWMYCNHPSVLEQTSRSDIIPTRSVIKKNRGESLSEQRTPHWCPYLKQEKENG